MKMRSVMGWLAWSAASVGVLAVSQLPGDFELSLCGPWG
jgi:hypothetical protein